MPIQPDLPSNEKPGDLDKLLEETRYLGGNPELPLNVLNDEELLRINLALAHYGAVGINQNVHALFNDNRHDLNGILILEDINFPINWTQPLPLSLSINGIHFSTSDLASLSLA